MKTETYLLPSFYASLLINDDKTGYTDEEINEINNWIDAHIKPNHIFWGIDCDIDNIYFSWNNDLNNLGAEVCNFTFDVSKIK